MISLISKVRSLVIILLLSGVAYAKNMTILVQPFQNTGDPEYSWVSAGMTASVISDLEKIRDITVISEMDRKKAVMEMAFAMSGRRGMNCAVSARPAKGLSRWRPIQPPSNVAL